MKISMKWMVLAGLLSASIACGDSLDKKMPVLDTSNNANNTNNTNNVVDANNDGPGDDPDDNNENPDPTNNANNVDPTNNANNLNNVDPANNQNANNLNNENPNNENPNNLNNENPNNEIPNPTEFRPIQVQLVWTTAADTDETDSNGTDLDLHVAHPLAAMDQSQPDQDLDGLPDPWFHDTYDCSWRNDSPDWGTAGTAHNPVQDIDDTNGQGPENVNIEQPEDVDYRIAAHYFQDNAFGQSVATVRIYVGGDMVAEYQNGLSQLDMWEVATIDGRTGKVTAGGRLTPDYSIGGTPE